MTPRESELVSYIRSYIAMNDGVSPTFREMAEAIGVKSPSGVARMVGQLVRDGRLKRRAHAFRGIELVDDRHRPSIDDKLNQAILRYAQAKRMTRDAVIAVALTEFLNRRGFHA